MTRHAWLLLAASIATLCIVVVAWIRFEGDPPLVSAPESVVLGARARTLSIELADEGAGLRHFSARLLHARGSRGLEERSFPGDLLFGGRSATPRQHVEIRLDVEAMKLPDGAATLALKVSDWSWRSGFDGNEIELSIPITIDTRPPEVEIESRLTYAHRGGSAAAVYRLPTRPEVALHGVRVDDAFFAGHPHPMGGENRFVAIFAIPADASAEPRVDVVAIDQAGNEGRESFPIHVLDRAFGSSAIPIGDAFLENVAIPLARAAGLPADDPALAFRQANEVLREANEKEIREHLRETAPRPLWQGAFLQMQGSRVMSRFAEKRSYERRGQEISTATHYGFDLASTRHAPVEASARGVVRFAGPLGIYGNCILIDHGLGLASLYGHLSELGVEAGSSVEQGAKLGYSGATGLAAGDHLHFAILVSGVYVDPLEWWDPRWVHNHIEVRLQSPGE